MMAIEGPELLTFFFPPKKFRMTKLPNLSVVIPVFNEQERLPKNLDKIINYLKKKGYSSEIILVDDGSTDNTPAVIKNYQNKHKIKLVKHSKNLGKGAAVKTGMLESSGKLVLMTDCDLSTPIEELSLLLKYAKDYDIVIGSRRLKEKKLGTLPARYRTFLGDIYYELLRLILLKEVKDTNCGFKLFSRKAVEVVFPKQTINRWGYDAEVLFIAHRSGFKIKEVPVIWNHFQGSKVKVLDAALRTLIELFSIKIRSLQGRYN